MFYLGVDVSKDSCRYLILNEEGKKVKSFTLDNTLEDFKKLCDLIDSLSIPRDKILIGLEATSGFWENLYNYLKEKGFSVVLLSPYQTHKFREALVKKAKTDDIDALVIAHLLKTGNYMQSQVAEEFIQSLREITKLRYDMVCELKNYKRRVISMLSVIFPEYEKTMLNNPFSATSIAILKKFPTAKDIGRARPKDIEKAIRAENGKFDIGEVEKLIETAKNSTYSGRAKDARSMSLQILLDHVKNIIESIERLDKEIDEMLSPKGPDGTFPGSNLLTIKGVGKTTLAYILSYLGADGSNFSSATKVVGYVGFYPKIYQSGQSLKENTISDRGVKVLRWVLYICAVSCINHNPEMRALYNRKLSQGKSRRQAIIYVAKKLLQIMLSMLKSGETYNPRKVFVSC